MVMKTLPMLPYLQNIRNEWHRQSDGVPIIADGGAGYREFLRSFGFCVPVRNACLEFPDDFSDHDLMLFVLRWS